MPDPVETPRYRAARVIARYDWEHGLSANGEPGRHTFGEIDALLDHPDILRELAESAAPVDTTPDLGNRGELVDVLDMYMRLDDRADAERVADALIARPALLRALSSRAAFTSPGDRVRAEPATETPMSRDPISWAYDALDRSRMRSREEPARWEVGQGIVDRLLATMPHQDDGPGLGSRTTCTTLLGVPLDVSYGIGPYGWRTLDRFGEVLASGVWTPTSPLDGNTPEAPDA